MLSFFLILRGRVGIPVSGMGSGMLQAVVYSRTHSFIIHDLKIYSAKSPNSQMKTTRWHHVSHDTRAMSRDNGWSHVTNYVKPQQLLEWQSMSRTRAAAMTHVMYSNSAPLSHQFTPHKIIHFVVDRKIIFCGCHDTMLTLLTFYVFSPLKIL